jgi:hypothetical protein
MTVQPGAILGFCVAAIRLAASLTKSVSRCQKSIQGRENGVANLLGVPMAPRGRVDQADRRAHHTQFTSARHAAPWCSAIILIATAVAHWPVAVLLAAAAPIIPVNMRMVALAIHDAAARQLADRPHLAGCRGER